MLTRRWSILWYCIKKFIETEFNFLKRTPHPTKLPMAALIDNASCQHHFGTPYSCQNLGKALEWARRKPGNPTFGAKACWRTVHTLRLRANIRKYFDSNPGCHFHLQIWGALTNPMTQTCWQRQNTSVHHVSPNPSCAHHATNQLQKFNAYIWKLGPCDCNAASLILSTKKTCSIEVSVTPNIW